MIVDIQAKYSIGDYVGHSVVNMYGRGVIVGMLITNEDATKVLYSVVFESGDSNFFHESELVTEVEFKNRINSLDNE